MPDQSSSTTVAVPAASEMTPLVGEVRLRLNVSLGSAMASPISVTVTTLVVSPAAKVTVVAAFPL